MARYKPRKGYKTVSAVYASSWLQKWYKKKLDALIYRMNVDVTRELLHAYATNEPEIAKEGLAQDSLPANELKKVMSVLTARWQARFDETAEALAEYFAQASNKRTTQQLKDILKRSGMAVRFEMSPAQRDVIEAIVQENVSLIKSIPQEYLKNVEGDTMRAVQKGMDQHDLAVNLEKNYGVTKRRAALISRDQTHKASGMLNRSRQLELGIERAVWQHSHAGKKPRPSHVRADGVEFDVQEGWYDPDVGYHIQPGELINCRCTCRSIIPGLG